MFIKTKPGPGICLSKPNQGQEYAYQNQTRVRYMFIQTKLESGKCVSKLNQAQENVYQNQTRFR